jgi:hypothetical protein
MARFDPALVALFGVALVVRLSFLFLEPATRPVGDETMWLMALDRLPAVSFSPFATYPLFHPPLYPYFLAIVAETLGRGAIPVVQALISSALVPLVGIVAARATDSKDLSRRAAAITALWPDFWWYSAHIWCETVFLSLLWAQIAQLVTSMDRDNNNDRDRKGGGARPRPMVFPALAAGILGGLAALTRETALYLAPAVATWLLMKRGGSRRLAISYLLGVLLTVAPWTLRNASVFDAFVPIATGGALNLYQGNAPLSRSDVYDQYFENEGRIEQYRWARAEGLRVIRDRQPRWIFEKTVSELPRLLEADSLALIHIRRGAYGEVSCSAYRLATAVFALPWILLAVAAAFGAAGWFVARSNTLETAVDTRRLLMLVVSVYALMHIATHGFSRYRLPILPAVVILAVGVSQFKKNTIPGASRSAFRVLAFIFLSGLVASLAPSIQDQLGHIGVGVPPPHEGFKPRCP